MVQVVDVDRQRAHLGGQLASQPLVAAGGVIMPGIADAAQLAASTTFLLSDDSTNINGAVLTSDGGWSAA